MIGPNLSMVAQVFAPRIALAVVFVAALGCASTAQTTMEPTTRAGCYVGGDTMGDMRLVLDLRADGHYYAERQLHLGMEGSERGLWRMSGSSVTLEPTQTASSESLLPDTLTVERRSRALRVPADWKPLWDWLPMEQTVCEKAGWQEAYRQ